MAAMDQEKLNNMVQKINNCAKEYENGISMEVQNILDIFNETWVSPSAQTLATEIQKCIESLENSITKTFEDTNEGIKSNVRNFNMVENSNIIYQGFSFGKPAINITLNQTLPNGKIGVSDNADLKNIKTPFNNLISKVNLRLDEIKNAVSTADAFDQNEQAELNAKINSINTTFTTEMTELVNSLDSRIENELSERQKLALANKQNISAS